MGLFKGHNTTIRENKISDFTVSTAQYGASVCEILGTTRISPNVIYWDDFTAHEHKSSQKSGKGGHSKTTTITYTYTVAVILALCEGQISGIGKMWKGKNVYQYPNGDVGLTLFSGTPDQKPWAYVQGKHPNKALAYENLAYMAGVIDLGDSGSMPSFNFEVKGKLLDTGDGVDVNPADYILYVLTKVGLGGVKIDGIDNYRQYCREADLLISTPSDSTDAKSAREIVNEIANITNAYFFWSNDRFKIVPRADRAVGNWKPDKTIRYNLTPDDFIPQSGGACITYSRKDSSEIYNRISVEFLNRANSYEKEVVNYQDNDDIKEFGVRQASTTKAHYIYTKTRAVKLAEELCRKNKYERVKYTFKLDWAFCRLEPGDLVMLNDPAMGIENQPAMIDSVTEGTDGVLTFTAISRAKGDYSIAEYDVHQGERPFINTNVEAPDTIPLIIQPPRALLGDVPEIWIAAKGAGDMWGGCKVFVSDDNDSYMLAGQIENTARMGTLVSGVTADATDIEVDSTGTFVSANEKSAQMGDTRCWLDGECIDYVTASLLSNGHWKLSGCLRGQDGTTAAPHRAGCDFVRLDEAILKIKSTKRRMGSTVYLKFPSFNIFYTGDQDLSQVKAHEVTLKTYYLPPKAPTNLTVSKVDWNATQLKLKWQEDPDPIYDVIRYNIYLNGAKLAEDVKESFFTYTATSSGTYTFTITAIDYEGGESDKSDAAEVTVQVEPADVSGFNIELLDTNRSIAALRWSANHEVDLSYYQVRTGDSWDDGKIVVDKTKALSAQYTLPSSGTYKFWIKAVNAEGYFSVNASYAYVDASLEPNAVTNLSVRQSAKDRSKAVISFSPSGGVDIDAYTIKRGDSWATGTVVAKTKETSVTIDIPSNDATTYMVQAKTIAGYESSVASYNFVAMVNPLDVTNFKAKKSTSESTRIVLTWDAPEESDIAYYVIKEGSDWDSAKTVAPRVSNVTYDVIVKDENTHNWMIKAVTIAGNESLHAASVSGVFSLRPTAVSAIQAVQSDTDRSKLLINWTNIDDPDLAGYETKIGDNWDSGEPLPFTKEIYAEKVLTASGTYKLMVKAKNTAGYYSDETSTTVNVKVEPDDVGGFIALQNGDSIELYWDRLAEKDIENYEIREGFSYDEGTPVARGVTGTSVILPIDVTRVYHYFIKARNKAGFESVHVSSAAVNVTALLPRNVIMTFDEIALANGTHSNTLFTDSKYNWQTFGGRFSDYPALKWEEAGSQKVLALNMPQVRNSDFSSSDISNWTNQGTALTYDSSVGHERAGSLKFKGPNRCYVILHLAKGTQITFSAWVKGKGAYLHVEYNGGDYSWNFSLNSKTSETDEWTKLSLTCPVTTSATSAFLFVYSQSEVWIDDVEITYNHVEGTYTTHVIDVSSVITCNVTSVFYSTTAMHGGSATLMVRTSQDNETWTSWQVFKPVQRTFRYIQFKVDMSTENTARSPEVSKFVISIDVPDTDIALKQTIAKGGSTVGYGHTFYTVPAVVAAAVGEGYHAEIVSRGKESCVIKVKDKSNTDTGGTCDIRIKGY